MANARLSGGKLKVQHYVCGYGSLMSHDSRYRYSGIDTQAIPVQVTGWQRAWNMASPGEKLTCVGATPKVNASLNALLVAVDEINDKLRKREANYHFIELSFEAIEFHSTTPGASLDVYPGNDICDARIWICQVANPQSSTLSHPIYQSYVDTCLSGCLEHADEKFAVNFVKQTLGCDGIWLNDREAGKYPRAPNINVAMQKRIDDLLQAQDVLRHRQEG